jgi:RNA polymerase sigma factor (sigma-70 family)
MTSDDDDSAAVWETVFRRSYPSVYRALVAVLLDADLAEDALQEAFAEGLRRPPASDHALAGWLFRVALRRARRIRGLGLPLRLDELVGSLREPDIPAQTEALLDRLQVGDLLRLLTRRQRAVVVAHYYLGLTQQEIADALGVRRGTVGATLSQALQHMRRGGSHVF